MSGVGHSLGLYRARKDYLAASECAAAPGGFGPSGERRAEEQLMFRSPG
jgi:hypothetical protein